MVSPKTGDGNYESGEATFLVHENLSGVNYSIKNGTITGTTAGMQYSLDGTNWTDCTAPNTAVTFKAGDTLTVRDKNDQTHSRNVITPALTQANAPTASTTALTSSSVTLTETAGWEYSRDGVTWQTGNVFTGLSASTAYTFHVRIAATDTALASKETSVTATTSAASSGTGTSGSGTSGTGGSAAAPTTPAAPSTTVTVDGKTTDAGKVTTATGTDGTKTTTVAVDSAVLEKQVTAADKGGSVAVTVPAATGTASAQLVVKDVENLNARDMSLEIKTGSVTYTVAPNAIDTAQVAAELGAADTAKVPLTVTVTPVKQSDVTVEKGTQVAPPVKFEVTASYNGKTVEVSHFDSYVSRTVELAEITDRNKITTGIRVEDGEQIPTEVIERNGRLYAKLNSLTNSTYTIIYNEAAFPDTAGKWYNDAVTEMASRTIVNGRTAAAFDGDGSVTRAEYAAILVRALGIPESGTSSFTDVAGSDWYYGAVSAAAKYGVILGYGDGTFKPLANISRQEAMTMLQRAAGVAKYAGTSGALTAFTDADQVAAWARDAAAFNIGSGLIVGSDSEIRPTDSITRAEAATVVLRLLQKAGLVDIRTRT